MNSKRKMDTQPCLAPPPHFWGLVLRPLEPQFHLAFPSPPPPSHHCQPAFNLGTGMGTIRAGQVHPTSSQGMVATLGWQHQGTFSGGLGGDEPLPHPNPGT